MGTYPIRFSLYCMVRKALRGAAFPGLGTFFSIAFEADWAYTRRAILSSSKSIASLSQRCLTKNPEEET